MMGGVLAEKDESDLLTGEDRAFARSVRDHRERRGLTQGELAKILRGQGFEHLSQVAISRIEQLKRAARLGEAEAIARVMGVPVSWMISPPSPAIAYLRELADAPAAAERDLERLGALASDLAEAWVRLADGVEFATEVRRKIAAERGEDDVERLMASGDYVDVVEADYEATMLVGDYLAAAGPLLDIDPPSHFASAYAEAVRDAEAADTDQ